MPRSARIDIPGVLQHVIVRGNERCDIFCDDEDRRNLVDRFAALLEETRTECYAWSLLPNHFHLLIRSRQQHLGSLGSFMRRLLTGYAVSFNRRHRRSGHLFQNRYQSIVCEEEPYLLELVRDIHLNPLRAGLVKDIAELDRYPWSGHRAIMGYGTFAPQNVDSVLALFGRTAGRSRERHIEDSSKTVSSKEVTMNRWMEDGDGCRNGWGTGEGALTGESLGAATSSKVCWETAPLSAKCAPT